MSTDGNKHTACPKYNANPRHFSAGSSADRCDDELCEKKRQKPNRQVTFPEELSNLVTQYFEPENPWEHVSPTTREQLLSEYIESCRRHRTPALECVVNQIQEWPESSLGGLCRAPRFCLAECSLRGAAAADSLEAVLRKVQFRRFELHDTAVDDEAAEAIFDMIEYYESANIVNITGSREFGIRGWQACSRMIKKSAEVQELEVREGALEPEHAPVLARALRPHHAAAALRVLALTRLQLAGAPLTCLVTMLKTNSSVRELKLGDNKLMPSDAEQLAGLLRLNTRIQLLDLSNNMIQDHGARHILEALAAQHAAHSPAASPVGGGTSHHCSGASYESRGLAFLVLWNNQLTRNCAQDLCKALRASPSLCVLNVGRNALGAEAARALAAAAGALHSLGLQAARLGPDAARALADLVRRHRALQRLDLRDNKLGGPGLQLILAAMKENTTLTQIDLDDASESSASLAAATRDIRALCRRNEPPAGSPRPHRKISLTCHSAACSLRSPAYGADEERRAAGGGRLRSPAPSPAPSPAGSPIPPQHSHQSRFSVTRVTPERDSSTDSSSPSTPTRPSYGPTSSRFKVVQVAEPPRIEVSSATDRPRRTPSRFQVTRNYDTTFNPSPRADEDAPSDRSDKHASECSNSDSNKSDNGECNSGESVKQCDNEAKYQDKSEEVSHNESLSREGDDNVVVSETKLVKTSKEMSESEKVDMKVEVTLKKECHSDCKSDSDDVNSVNTTPAKVSDEQNCSADVKDVLDKDERVHDFTNIDEVPLRKTNSDAMKQIEAITEDFGNLIQEMKDMSMKTKTILTKKCDKDEVHVKSDSTQTDIVNISVTRDDATVPVSLVRDNLVLKKNKSESSLDSPDLEVSRLTKKMSGAFCDSNSSLDVSGSSVESLNPEVPTQIVIPEERGEEFPVDRRKDDVKLSTESSLDSNTSELTPLNSNGNFLNTSISSNESVSPIIFCRNKKMHGSLSSLEASVSSLDSTRGANQEKIMVTSADSGIEYSLQNPSEKMEESSSNEGTLTHNLSSESNKDTKKVAGELQNVQDTLTSSPKRTSSLLDVPALKNKGLDRMRKISWGPPSPSFHIPKPEPEPPKPESKLPHHLERFLSIFQNPGNLFSRSSSEEEKRSTSNTPPRKEPTSLSSSFWAWSAGASSHEKERPPSPEDRDSSPENATESTLSMERVQVSFVDESFSRKLDSKTPSTDTDNTLSEFQSLPIQCTSEASDGSQQEFLDAERCETTDRTECVTTEATTEGNIVQKQLDLSLETEAGCPAPICDIEMKDLIVKQEYPIDISENLVRDTDNRCAPDGDGRSHCDSIKPDCQVDSQLHKSEVVRPRSFAAVLKSTSENTMDKQTTPESGQSIDNLPIKIIRGIKENISPENTLTSSMTNTKALAQGLTDTKQLTVAEANNQIVNSLWEVSIPCPDINRLNDKAQIELKDTEHAVIDSDDVFKETNVEKGVVSLPIEQIEEGIKNVENLENIDLGKDALAFLVYENQDFEPDSGNPILEIEDRDVEKGTVLSEELRDAEITMTRALDVDLSPELVCDETLEIPEMLSTKDVKGLRSSPVIPERAKLKKSNSLEELSQRLQRIDLDEENVSNVRKSKIVFQVPDATGTKPKDIPERRYRLRTRSGSSPKSLPENLIKPSPIAKFDGQKKKKKVSSLGKMARDSLLALNMSEEEIAEFRRSYKLTSVESLRSLESVSEDANSQSNSIDSRCRICLRTSQESLMSLDSISEDCRCGNRDYCGESSHSAR